MAITPAQLEARKNFIGSSDIAAILGLNPYATAWDVWCDKVGLEKKDQGDMSKARFGTRMEPVLREWLADELGRPVVECKETAMHSSIPYFGDHADCLVLGRTANDPGEIKVSGLLDGWGDPGTADVPSMVTAQCLWHMAMHPKSNGVHVVRCLPDRHDWVPSRYFIDRDSQAKDAIAVVLQAADEFWRSFVIPRKAPDARYAPSAEALKRVHRAVGVETPIRFALVETWIDLRERRLGLEKDEAAAKDLIVAELARAGATVGVCAEGRFVYQPENAGLRVNIGILKENFPEVHEQVAEASTREVPRWKPNKLGVDALQKDRKRSPKSAPPASIEGD